MNRINIYVQDKILASLIVSLDPPCNIYFSLDEAQTDFTAKDIENVFIVDDLPREYIDGVKYILSSKNPYLLTTKQLEHVFDLWPEKLNPTLLKFYLRKLLVQLKAELDITSEELQHQKRILEMARQDCLTGLATRWYLQEYVESNKNEENIVCIYFDLDNFKSVNDTYGHQAGDRALAATAEMMQREFTDGFVARMGGDEFMIVLRGLRNIAEVESKVNSFMKNLLDYYQGVNTMKKLSVSAGISQRAKRLDKSIDRLIHESDIALYEAKKTGKACCKIYSPSMEAAIAKA